MGMNLCVQHLETHRSHPDWDDAKYSIDKTIAELFYQSILPLEIVKWDPFTQDPPTRRPLDLDIWKLNVRHISLVDDEETQWLRERVSTLITLLEANPDYGVYISV